jgi:hypothetical protein
LRPFLEKGDYDAWPAESDYHESDGPHGGGVRVFYGPKAAASLQANAEVFTRGSATIKELTSDGFLYGLAVWVKVSDDADEGNGFYWYELIKGNTPAEDLIYGDGLGHSDCVSCHADGPDYFLSSGQFE